MDLETKNSAINEHQQLHCENVLWQEISENAQPYLYGGMSERIRIKLKSYDHQALDKSFLFASSADINSQPFMRWRDRFLR